MALEDIASLRAVHGSTVLHPCDGNSTAKLVAAMADLEGISYLRTLRPNTPVLYGPDEEFPIGGSQGAARRRGDVTIVGCGITVHEALKAADELGGIGARVIDCYSVKPIDARDARGGGARRPASSSSSRTTGPKAASERRCSPRSPRGWLARVPHLAVRDMPHSGKPDELLAAFGIDAAAIVKGAARGTSLSDGMAVVIGTSLRKELSGGLLFDGVSFKVERRERMALSGPNGAGKTTLLRMLAGETGIDGGQLVLDKGTRVALHDQRPPLDLGLSLREYALSGARDLDRARGGAAPAGGGDGRRRPRAGDDGALLRGAGASRARGRLRVARELACDTPRARLRRRPARPAARRRSPAAS